VLLTVLLHLPLVYYTTGMENLKILIFNWTRKHHGFFTAPK